MTTQLDDQFVSWLVSAFDANELATMGAVQREVMRDTFAIGFAAAVKGLVMDPEGELAQYRQEHNTEISKTKARHCVQEALILKRAEN